MKNKIIIGILLLLCACFSVWVLYMYKVAAGRDKRFSKAFSVLKYGESNDGQIVLDNLTHLAE